eukprot:scaffold30763_cov30-Tisochrysis_lutea.AAC.3
MRAPGSLVRSACSNAAPEREKEEAIAGGRGAGGVKGEAITGRSVASGSLWFHGAYSGPGRAWVTMSVVQPTGCGHPPQPHNQSRAQAP